MATYILVMYLTTGWGTVSTGGPLVVDDISSHAACEKIAGKLKAQVGSKYDWHFCEEITK